MKQPINSQQLVKDIADIKRAAGAIQDMLKHLPPGIGLNYVNQKIQESYWWLDRYEINILNDIEKRKTL